MQHRCRVFIETQKGRVSDGFGVSAPTDAADVSMRLRDRGWAPYRLKLDHEQDCWVATVVDWRHAA